ncbi:MAG TPA: methylenetetrahydrofolate reductase C-terminal domain-containing protein [Gaiella sp.]|jgi:methylenetetrahydrofolate reductase (NADPH)
MADASAAVGRPATTQGMRLRTQLADPERFVIASELVTSRGLISQQRGARVLSLARELAAHPRIDVLSITDNPGGHAMLSPDTLGTDLISRGQEVIVHLSCKDWNRNALESRAWKLGSEGFENVLALSGDYPVSGYKGTAAPVFDVDSVGLLRMLSDLNEGVGIDPSLGRTSFLLGCVVTNHKRYEREVVPQLLKLRKKVENGARFVINQIGYDARKDDELLRWMRLNGLGEIPVLANVYLLTPRVAEVFNAQRIPGVVVTDELLELARTKERRFFLELAAKQVAIARGLGYRGAYLGGHMSVAEYDEILELADSFADGDWRAFAREIQFAFPDEWYFFEQDPETGLATDTPAGLGKGRAPLRYRFSRRLHTLAFEPDAPLHGAGCALYGAVDGKPRIGKALHLLEQAVKVPTFGCKDCGDCSLPDIAYLCPESQCVKNQRNGPCGGTRQGKCEIGEKDCIWALAYDRLKVYGEQERMLDGPVVVKDNQLRGTSAWANTFLGRDHNATREDG